LMAEAGVSLPRLSKAAANQGVGGYEFLIGIPGTVGGALAMNAGLTVFRPKEVRDIVDEVEIIDRGGNVHRVSYESLHPGYRCSDLLHQDHLVCRAWFRLTAPADPEEIHQRTLQHLADRKRKQPLDRPTAGSTFKQPPGGKPAGWYIEQAGLRGLQVGGVRVSPKHANWIENLGPGTARDVMEIIHRIKETVQEKFSVSLEEEIRYLRSSQPSPIAVSV